MIQTRDALNAFLDYPDIPVTSAQEGALLGCTLGVKDLFDIAGYPTGGGNPEFEKSRPPAARTAPVVTSLLEAGAHFKGKTQTDEFAFSLFGENAHYPSPVNSAAPQRVTGGSSSGSAAAVAGGLVEVALGTDTAGSIRAPASFCGLPGLRTTHARISTEGVLPLAPSFDTVGWFARDLNVYAKVSDILLGADTHETTLTQPMRIAELETRLFGAQEQAAYGTMANTLADRFGRNAAFLALPGEADELVDTFRTIQAYEAWQTHGPFLSGKRADLGPGVKQRFEFGRSITPQMVEAAHTRRQRFQDEFQNLFDSDMVLILPTVPSAAPLKNSTDTELDFYRAQTLLLTAISGLLGWPQISLPIGEVHGAPFGISLLGPAGSDRQMVDIALNILSER